MGCCFSCNEPRIKIIDETPEGVNFYYLRPKGTITYTIGRFYNTPLIELYFDGWFESSDRLWAKSWKSCWKEHLHLHQAFLLFHLKVELILNFSL